MSAEACRKAFIAISELIAEKCSIDPESDECKRATQASLELIDEKCKIVVPEVKVPEIEVAEVEVAEVSQVLAVEEAVEEER